MQENGLSIYTDIELEEELDKRKSMRAKERNRVRCKDCMYSFFKKFYRCKVNENRQLTSWGVWRVCDDFLAKNNNKTL